MPTLWTVASQDEVVIWVISAIDVLVLTWVLSGNREFGSWLMPIKVARLVRLLRMTRLVNTPLSRDGRVIHTYPTSPSYLATRHLQSWGWHISKNPGSKCLLQPLP